MTSGNSAKACTFGIAMLAAVSASASAGAADLGGGRRGYDYPPPVEPRTNIERWTGFYLGGAIGGSRGQTDVNGSFGSGNMDLSGWNASVLAGYNWQLGRIVLGVESDFGTGPASGSISNGVSRYGMDINAIGSLRARAGFLMTPSLLVYATGGYAFANTDIGLDGGDKTRQWLTGTQLGLGTELKLDQKWTMRLEYIHTNLGDTTLTHSGQVNRFEPDFHTVRAGLTFKF